MVYVVVLQIQYKLHVVASKPVKEIYYEASLPGEEEAIKIRLSMSWDENTDEIDVIIFCDALTNVLRERENK